jgi:ABC-type phosphate transport system substrate-binding protein
MVRSVVVVMWLVACQSTPSGSKTAPAPQTAAAVDPLRPAHDHEHGRGVVRDYAKAAEIYRRHCDNGAGDLAACRRLLDAIASARGVDRDIQAAFSLAQAMCQRDDLVGCLVHVEATRGDESLGAKLVRLIAVPCDAQHLARCEVAREPFSGFSQSSAAEYKNHRYDQQGCQLGVLEACARLRYATGPEHDEAMHALASACVRGDAEACEAVGQPLPPRELCSAHDFTACLALGCAGDANAAAAALANHAGSCEGVRTGGAVATDVKPSARPTFDSLEFRPAGEPITGYSVFNAGTRPIKLANVEVYGYDAAGSQTGREHVELREPLAPGAGTMIALRDRAARFEPCVSAIVFDDDAAHYARCPDKKPQHVRWGDGRDNVVLTMSFLDIPFAGMDGLDERLSVPFERTHFGLYVHTASDAAITLASESTEPYWIAQWETTRGPHLPLPFVLEPTAIVYQLDKLPGLRLSADALAGMFSGTIKRWNDRAIARDNPGRALPDLAIKVLQPWSPGDQVRLTRYLARFAAGVWKQGARRRAPLLPNVQRIGWDDGTLRSTPGAISFVGPGVAAKLGLDVALVGGAGGAFVAPTTSEVSSGAYPIASQRILYVTQAYPSAEQAAAARTFVDWLLDDGLAIFEQLGYARPAAAVTQAARAQLRRIDVRPPGPVATASYVAGELALRVRVVGPGRQPSAEARVVHRSYDASVQLDRTTDRAGTLVIDHVPTAPQRYALAVRGKDGAVGQASIDVSKPGRVDVTVALRASSDPGVLHVRVLDKQRQPVPDAHVVAAGISALPTDPRGETALDLHDRYLPDVKVWSSKGVSDEIGAEIPERAPTTVIVGD